MGIFWDLQPIKHWNIFITKCWGAKSPLIALANQVNYLIFQVSYINPFKYINKVKVISVTIWQLCKNWIISIEYSVLLTLPFVLFQSSSSKILEINEQRTLRLEVLISALDRPKQSTLGSALLLLLFPIDLPEYH